LPNSTEKLLNGEPSGHEDVVKYLTRNENVHKKSFLDILLHTHFLGQHSIRDFIYGNRLDKDENITSSRYNLLAEMFGFGEVELLKKRLTNILSQIKRSKVREAEQQIDLIKTQIRGMHQKYGPKCRHDLEKMGFQIKLEPAIEKYRQVTQRLADHTSPDIIKQINLPTGQPVERYQGACESIRNLIASHLKQLEVQAADIKSLNRQIIKIGAMFPEVSISQSVSVKKFVEELRQKMSVSIKAVEQAQQEIQTIDNTVESLNQQASILAQFSVRFEQYQELLDMEQKVSVLLQTIQQGKSELLQRHGELMAKLAKAADEEQGIKDKISELQARSEKCEQLQKMLSTAKSAENSLQHQTNRITGINDAISVAQNRLVELNNRMVSAGNQAASEVDATDWETFRANTHYQCPCCGAKYEAQNELEKGIREQLASGMHRQELHAFMVELDRKNVEATRKHLHETVQTLSREKAELEQSNKAQAKILTAFKILTSELSLAIQPSEEILRDMMHKCQQDIEATQQSLNNHAAKALREQIAKLQTDLNSHKDEDHKKHLAQIQREILEFTRPITGIIPVTELREKGKIQAHATKLSKDISALSKKKEHLLENVRLYGVTPQRERDFDESVSEIESLFLRQETLRGHSLVKTTALGEDNLDKQRLYYELSKEVAELTRLFGLLTTEERSETLKNSLEKHESERKRWEACYRAVENINTELSKLSHSGLQESLAQYGPLINQIYQKFIRHDIFAEVLLKSTSSKKARKRDLFLRLKSYSGETEYTPASYLSEAQLNILALSIFLTRVMYQNISALETVFIDDPIQQMDDMNAAAFVDVILGLSSIGKQIIITTCNHDFYRLVAHKMRSVSSVSFKAVDLDSTIT
jgi:DNA repair exonuclease SbcCD ATPase subunit